jgi:anaerobic selenocysteine-containing dehydrogenase
MKFDRLLNIIKEEDYRGHHLAPDKDAAVLYDVSKLYPDDIYTLPFFEAVRYYGDSSDEYSDAASLSIIRSAHNKPNKPIKIYRAVPKILSNQEKIYDLEKQKRYILKYGKIPPHAQFHTSNKSEYYEYLNSEIDRITNLPPESFQKIKINSGDWVTINSQYAVVHGKSALLNKYRIISKTVPAKHLFTDADSLHEWGYDPS